MAVGDSPSDWRQEDRRDPAIDLETFKDIMKGVPIAEQFGCVPIKIGYGHIVIAMPYRDALVRPGGTVTGPAMFALADLALYGLVLSAIGRVELAVTTSMTINFLRRPRPKDIVGEGRLIKLGRRLAYGDVMIYTDGDEEPVAHATGTYSIPPER